MKRLASFLSVLWLCLLHSQAIATPLDVILKTSTSLTPVYLAPMYTENPSFDQEYPQQLHQILRFDLDNSGATIVLDNHPDFDEEITSLDFQHPTPPKELAQQAKYLIGLQVKNAELSLYLIPTNLGRMETIKDVPLTGKLDMDRRQIHQMADTIQKTLFGTPGIASSRLLFTIVYPTLIGPELGWHGEVWEADYDGHNLRQITNEGNLCVTPTYLPTKNGDQQEQLLYVSYSNGQPKILIGSINPTKPRRLTFLRGNQLMPAISRQQDNIAFISDVAGNPDLFIIPYDPNFGAAGKPRQIFTSPLGTQASPSFSPDGKTLAFVSNKDGSPRIYIMDIPKPRASLKSLKPKLISKMNRENTAPEWSPDGTKIVYCSKTDEVRQIWIFDLKTGKETQMTTGPLHKENPTWGPDSRHIIYNTVDPKSNDLFLLTLDSPRPPIKITEGPGEKRYPAWG